MSTYLKLKELNLPFVKSSSVSLEAARGDVIGITGANGSGKTVLARILAGIERPDALGKYQIDGLDPFSQIDAERLRRISGMVFQNPDEGIAFDRVSADLVFRLENAGMPADRIRKRTVAYLRKFGLHLKKNQEYANLPAHQQQLAQLAAALSPHPALLILDEAFSFQPVEKAEEIMELILRRAASRKQTVIFFTKQRHLLEMADRKYLLADGRLSELDPEEADRILTDDTPVWENRSDIRQIDLYATGRRVAVSSAIPDAEFLDHTVLDDIMFGPMATGVPKKKARAEAEAVLRTMQIPESLWLRSPRTLSGGEKRMVQIAGVITQNPDILLLHRPFSGLDRENTAQLSAFLHALEEAGKTVYISEIPEKGTDYVRYKNGLRRVDPRLKIWMLLLSQLFLLVTGKAYPLLFATAFVLMLWGDGRISPERILKYNRGNLAFTVLLGLILLIAVSPAVAGIWVWKILLMSWSSGELLLSIQDADLPDALTGALHMNPYHMELPLKALRFFTQMERTGIRMERAGDFRGLRRIHRNFFQRLWIRMMLTVPRYKMTAAELDMHFRQIERKCYMQTSGRRRMHPLRMNRQSVFVAVIFFLFLAGLAAMWIISA